MSLVRFVLLATTKPVKVLVTTILIYNKNYLENGIHLRILLTLNTALEFIIKFRNLNNPKPFLSNSILAVAVRENRDLKIQDGREDDGAPKDGKDWA